MEEKSVGFELEIMSVSYRFLQSTAGEIRRKLKLMDILICCVRVSCLVMGRSCQ